MRLGILTSVETRHRYFAQALREHFHVDAIGYEQTGYAPAAILPPELDSDEVRIVTEHFAERARQEEFFFGATEARSHEGTKRNAETSNRRIVESSKPTDGRLPAPRGAFDNRKSEIGNRQSAIGPPERQIASGSLNSDDTLRFLDDAGVDTLIVYGTNLIKEPLLGRFAGRIINMHLGLSPYYRGTATNFYPLLNEEPQYVGATIHLIDPGIDSGPIFKHARPEIVANDMPHTIGCKAILAGIDAMIDVLRDFAEGHASAVPQWPVPNARLYLRKDYHPRQVVELYRKLEGGVIARYVERMRRAPADIRLVE